MTHVPVLRDAACGVLEPRDGGVYIDGTFGGGGYTRALLDMADTIVVAIDRDPDAVAEGQDLAAQYGARLHLVRGRFADMAALAEAAGYDRIDGIVLDLGVSSMQFDRAGRGFAFSQDGPLDMRMGQEGVSADTLLNRADPDLLARIIAVYGEEKRARAIARAIVAHRHGGELTRTGQLADVVCGVVRRAADGVHPATRTFQALRIYLNDELGELLRALQAAEKLLRPEGRLAVVTFHSLEDRMVKRFFARRTGRAGRVSRHIPPRATLPPSFAELPATTLPRRGRTPDDAEIAANPRARSARLRAAARTHAAPIDDIDGLMPRRAPHLADFRKGAA